MKNRENIIHNYIDGYNQFDTERMVADFADNILFENIQQGEINLSLLGREAFKEQEELVKGFLAERTQTVRSIRHFDDRTEVEIEYKVILGVDVSGGLKKGQELFVSAISVFEFCGDKICKLTFIS